MRVKSGVQLQSKHFQAAVEEGIVVGGGCTLLRLAAKVDAIKHSLDNEEEKVIYYVALVESKNQIGVSRLCSKSCWSGFSCCVTNKLLPMVFYLELPIRWKLSNDWCIIIFVVI